MKVVGKSIRDRVALIKWRRDRRVPLGNGDTAAKKTQQNLQPNLLQVPGGVPQGATLATDSDDQEAQTLICSVPTTTSTTCTKLHKCKNSTQL